MCTGIFVFGPRPVLALNFDYHLPFRLTLENDDRFCMRIRYGAYDGLPLGVNKNGCSANIQLAPFKKKAVYDPHLSNGIQPGSIVRQVLEGRRKVADLPAYFQTHPMMYSPDNTGAHCMCADKYGHICIAEPGVGCLTEEDFPEGFAVLTNFNLAEYLPTGQNTGRIRCRRYKTACQMLAERIGGPERLMEILEAADAGRCGGRKTRRMDIEKHKTHAIPICIFTRNTVMCYNRKNHM